MPREKSELTKNRRFVGMHMTPEQHTEWKRLGAQKWLRTMLALSIEKNQKESQ